MKINFLGDSITAGAGASVHANCYVKAVESILGCEVCNFGVGGTRIATQRVPSEESMYDEHFMLRAEKMGAADFVFVFGGTNDYGHGDAELGKMGDTSEYTFYGAFYTLATYLVNKYSRERVCFILPIPRYNQNSPLGSPERQSMKRFLGTEIHLFSEYVEAEREVLSSLGINYLDLSDIFPEPKSPGASELFIDGLHPNDKGHRLIAEKIADYVRSANK